MLFALHVLREAFQVGRPAMGLVTSFLYLYNNHYDPSLVMTLYFGFIFQLGCNAGNDYMDWERDSAEQNREFSVSRGKAKSKDAVWWYYVVATVVSLIVVGGCRYDPLFGAQYFVLTELAGQFAYNGIFLGIPIHELSIVKSIGFPLDVVVAAWTYMPFAYLVGQKIWIPDLTIAAWGTTMLWAQLKDYHHEKHNSVKTTATILGPTWTALLISLAAVVMVRQDPRFLPYGIYTLYRCYIYPDLGVGKMSVIMALNLVGIVLLDKKIPPNVKFPAFGLHVVSFLAYKYSFTLEQKYYGIMGIINRHRPYDNRVWQEEDPNVLLWKVGALTGRSASGATGLFGTEYARLCLMGFVYFRTQDTWADVCLDSEDRIRGLQLLPKRLDELLTTKKKNGSSGGAMSSLVAVSDDPTLLHEKVRWDLESRPRNRMYVDIALNVHRFDTVFLALPSEHQEILVQYVNALSKGWIELEQLKDEPVTPEIMRKHAEVALDAGFFGMCRGAAPELLAAIDPTSKSADLKASDAYVAFSDFIWYMNLCATIEEDVKEGVVLDVELRSMKQQRADDDGCCCLDPEVIRRVRIKWLIKALTFAGRTTAFLHQPKLVGSWALRFFILQFLKTSANLSETYFREYQSDGAEAEIVKNKSTGMTLLGTFVESFCKETYETAVDEALNKLQLLLGELQELALKNQVVTKKEK